MAQMLMQSMTLDLMAHYKSFCSTGRTGQMSSRLPPAPTKTFSFQIYAMTT